MKLNLRKTNQVTVFIWQLLQIKTNKAEALI